MHLEHDDVETDLNQLITKNNQKGANMMCYSKRYQGSLETKLVSDIKAYSSTIVGCSNVSHLTDFKTLLLRQLNNLANTEIISDEYDDTQALLVNLRDEMIRRHKLLNKAKCKDITTYNDSVPAHKRLQNKVMIINHFEQLCDEPSSLILLNKTLLPKLRVTGILIIALFDTSNLGFDKTSPIFELRVMGCRRMIENFNTRIALDMRTREESILFVGNADAMHILDNNKAIYTNAYFRSRNRELSYHYS